LVVEDELIIAEDMRMMLENLGYIVTGVALDFDEAQIMLEADKPDIVLTDIALGGEKDGVDLAQEIKVKHEIPFIFVTSHSDKSTLDRAKFVKPNGYLVKPFEEKDLYTSIEIAIANFSGEVPTSEEDNEPRGFLVNEAVYVKDGHALVKVKLDELFWLKSEGNYIELHQSDKRNVVRSTLHEFLDKLPANKFFRVHKSHAVNIEKIDAINGTNITIGGEEIPIGRQYKEELISKLNTA